MQHVKCITLSAHRIRTVVTSFPSSLICVHLACSISINSLLLRASSCSASSSSSPLSSVSDSESAPLRAQLPFGICSCVSKLCLWSLREEDYDLPHDNILKFKILRSPELATGPEKQKFPSSLVNTSKKYFVWNSRQLFSKYPTFFSNVAWLPWNLITTSTIAR